jgi:TP901 family phage tail tape measure protein
MSASSLMVANLFARMTADTSQFDRSMAKVASKMRHHAEDMTQMGRSLSMGITAPLMGVGIAAGKTAMDFEAAMMRMITLVGMNQEVIEEWSGTIKDMAGDVGKSATELGESMFFITSAGIRSKESLEVLEASAKAAAIGMGETQKVAHAAVSAMNAYGKGNLAAKDAVATLIATVREGNMEAKSLPMAFGRVLPVAAQLEVSFRDVGAAIAMMTRSGTTARLSAFALRSILMTFAAPTQESKKAAEELGLSWEELRNVVKTKGLLPALEMMKDAVGDNTERFRDLIPNSRAYIGILQLVGKSVEDTRTVFDSLNGTTGELVDTTHDLWKTTDQAKLQIAYAELSEAAVDLGRNIAPLVEHLTDAARVVSRLAKAFNELPGPVKDGIGALVGIAVTAGPALYFFGMLTRALAGVVSMFGVATAKAGLFGAAMKAQSVAVNSAANSVQYFGAKLGPATVATSANVKAMKAMGGASLLSNASLITLAGTIGWLIGTAIEPFVTELFGLEEKFDGLINKVQGLKEGMTQIQFQEQLDAYSKLREKLHLVGEEWRVQADFTKENAKRLKELTSKAIEFAHAQNEVVDSTRKFIDKETSRKEFLEQVPALLEKSRLATEAYNETLKEEYDLLNKEDIAKGMDKLVEDFNAMKDIGIDNNQLADAFNGKLIEMLEHAKNNKMELPAGIKEMAKALGDEADPAIKKLMDDIGSALPEHVNAMPGKIIPGMVKVGGEIATQLSGGFNRGFEEGVNKYTAYQEQLKNMLGASLGGGFTVGFDAGRTEINNLAEGLKNRTFTINAIPNYDVFWGALQDILDGKVPDTGG